MQALSELYRLALFSPGAKTEGASATATNVLLRAERALAGTSISGEQSLPLELAALRADLEERQERLKRVHDALRREHR